LTVNDFFGGTVRALSRKISETSNKNTTKTENRIVRQYPTTANCSASAAAGHAWAASFSATPAAFGRNF